MERAPSKILRWFTDSPDAGDPSCLCSYCGERIEAQQEGEDDPVNDYEGEPIRMWQKGGNLEMRFHPRCFAECITLGLIDWPK